MVSKLGCFLAASVWRELGGTAWGATLLASPTPSPTCTQETRPCTWTPSMTAPPHPPVQPPRSGPAPGPGGEQVQRPQGRGGPHQQPHRPSREDTTHILSGTGPSWWASEPGPGPLDAEARPTPFPPRGAVSWPRGPWAGAARCGKAVGAACVDTPAGQALEEALRELARGPLARPAPAWTSPLWLPGGPGCSALVCRLCPRTPGSGSGRGAPNTSAGPEPGAAPLRPPPPHSTPAVPAAMPEKLPGCPGGLRVPGVHVAGP